MMQEMEVPPAREGSIEYELHKRYAGDQYFIFSEGDLKNYFSQPVKHRAIGVVYNPERDKFGNYVPSVMSQRYNAFIYIDETTALHPLHSKPHDQKIPETYPFGF